MSSPRLPVMVLLAALACGESRPRATMLLPEDSEVPLAIREDCALTEEKCTRCHTLGRIVVAHAHTRTEWEPYVRRMRVMASSGITTRDAESVLRCLEFRGARAER